MTVLPHFVGRSVFHTLMVVEQHRRRIASHKMSRLNSHLNPQERTPEVRVAKRGLVGDSDRCWCFWNRLLRRFRASSFSLPLRCEGVLVSVTVNE